MNWNEVTLAGRLADDPDIRQTNDGRPVANLRLCLVRRWKDSVGDFREETVYLHVTAWGHYAEVVQEQCTKGTNVFIRGYLTTDKWESKATGEPRSRLKVTAKVLFVLEDSRFYDSKAIEQDDKRDERDKQEESDA